MALQPNALTTVASVKTYLKITHSVDDQDLEDLINECSDMIERYVDRSLKDSGAVTEYYNGNINGKIFVRKYPVNSVTSVAYASGTLDAPTWNILPASTGYVLDQFSGVLNVANMYQGIRNYQLIYRGGFTTVPSDIVRACKICVADAYNHSDGTVNESVGGASASWETEIPKRARNILNKYRRFTF